MDLLAILEQAFHAAMVEQQRAKLDLDNIREKGAELCRRQEMGPETDVLLQMERRASMIFEVAAAGSCLAYGRLLEERERRAKAEEVAHA